ncbi:uncharacterized protein [Coffea arabica]|uniref:CCHC-type domain-containing protein n=1 Tax=Coffea arabica TaxID=13443 RepID=A0A6P6UI43_COFAR
MSGIVAGLVDFWILVGGLEQDSVWFRLELVGKPPGFYWVESVGGAMESIKEVLRKFKLSEEEREGVRLDEEEVAKGFLECKQSLIGKVWGEKLANIGGIKSFANNMWPQVKHPKVVETGRNLFQFIFEKEKEIEMVLSRRPWIYDGQPLILLRWEAGLEEDEKALSRTLIWVQIWNLPLHWVTKEVGRKIGSIFSRVEEVIIPQNGRRDGKHMKILVEMDLSIPLPRGTMVNSNGGKRWIEFKYEKCPDFCFGCGLIGHSERNCNKRGMNLGGEPQFGNWLRASYPRSPTRKNRSGDESGNRDDGKSHFQDHKGGGSEGHKLLLTYTEEFHKQVDPKQSTLGKLLGDSNKSREEEKRVVVKRGVEVGAEEIRERRQGKGGMEEVRNRELGIGQVDGIDKVGSEKKTSVVSKEGRDGETVSGEEEGVGSKGRQKSKSIGKYRGGKSWRRLVLEVSRRKPLSEIGADFNEGVKGKRKVEGGDGRGGLAVLWKQELRVKKVLFTSFTIELLIEDEETRVNWWCICVYASTDVGIRREQWEVVTRKSVLWGEYWAVIGDFNDITSNDEKWGGIKRAEIRFQDFTSFINKNELVDIGFEGVPWTWCNNWGNGGEMKERLDRIMGTRGWVGKFDKAKCLHIETEASDHCMLLLDIRPGERKWKRRFMFDRRWLLQEDIREVVGKAWGEEQQGSRLYKVKCKIKRVRMDMLNWSKGSRRNSKKLIEQIKREIKEVKEIMPSGYRIKLVGLKRRLTDAYKKEELYWSQKARVKWLKEGDRNTSFFHAIVAGRRKQNRISVLQKRSEEWCENVEESSKEIIDYFQEIFTTENPVDFVEILQGVPQTITSDMNRRLTRPITEQEIRQAVFSMQPNKSPGPDGMPPYFFQKFWQTVKSDIVNAVQSFFHSGYLLKSINETLISLIPKTESPISITEYRPISLCNVLYKIISKVLTSRFKSVLNVCISESQSAFVPDRQILDNVLIAHECVHF